MEFNREYVAELLLSVDDLANMIKEDPVGIVNNGKFNILQTLKSDKAKLESTKESAEKAGGKSLVLYHNTIKALDLLIAVVEEIKSKLSDMNFSFLT